MNTFLDIVILLMLCVVIIFLIKFGNKVESIKKTLRDSYVDTETLKKEFRLVYDHFKTVMIKQEEMEKELSGLKGASKTSSASLEQAVSPDNPIFSEKHAVNQEILDAANMYLSKKSMMDFAYDYNAERIGYSNSIEKIFTPAQNGRFYAIANTQAGSSGIFCFPAINGFEQNDYNFQGISVMYDCLFPDGKSYDKRSRVEITNIIKPAILKDGITQKSYRVEIKGTLSIKRV